MLFNSLHFLLFFPLMVVGYFCIPHRFRWAWLLIGSCYFYASFVPKYLIILFFVIGINYAAGLCMHRAKGKTKRHYFITSILLNVGVLFLFKYFNFFNENISFIATLLHWNYPIHTLRLILPLGLSFHTFQGLSYLIEVYKGRQAPEKHLGIFALYVLFFPQLVAGPIERPQRLLPQFKQIHAFDYNQILSGLKLMVWGFFKKIVIADRLALLVDPIYGNISGTPGPVLLTTMFLFAFQLYCDFSGYSTIARGSARVFGIELMENFKRPYFAKNVAEFWRRWHISLSSWLHDYVYYPIIFSVSRPSRTWIYASIVLTFLVSGLWHGAGWTYIGMGAFFGIAIALGAATKTYRERLGKRFRFHIRPQMRATWQLILTFLLASTGWIFFRAATITDVWTYLAQLPRGWKDFFAHIADIAYLKKTLFLDYEPSTYFVTLACVALLIGIDWIHEKRPHLLSPKSLVVRSFAVTLFIALIIVFGEFNSKEFIYFQF